MVAALLTPGKLAREDACRAIQDEVGTKLAAKFGAEKVTDFIIKDAFYYIQKEAVRGLILKDGKRLDGRSFDVVRPISAEVGLLPRAHGSALFSRGETQTLTLVTLGTGDDVQEFDAYTAVTRRKNSFCTITSQFLRRRNRPYFRPRPARNRPRRACGTFPRTDDAGGKLSVHHPRHERDHGIERLNLDGDGLRRLAGIDGCRCAVGSPGGGHQYWLVRRIRRQ